VNFQMLRLIVLLLWLANLGYWTWSEGYLREAGLGPAAEREPQRLARQLRPEALTVQPLAAPLTAAPPAAAAATPAAPTAQTAAPAPVAVTASAPAAAPPPASAAVTAVAAASAPAANGGACLQVGVFDAHQIEAVRAAAAALPRGSWRIDQVTLPGRWMVYLKLADADAVAARRAEVRALGVDTDRPAANFEPGLSLGRFASEDAAQRAMVSITHKGVQGARVVQERSDAPAFVLRLPAADAAQRAGLRALRPALGEREVHPCS
jgi:hypothetical protein